LNVRIESFAEFALDAHPIIVIAKTNLNTHLEVAPLERTAYRLPASAVFFVNIEQLQIPFLADRNGSPRDLSGG